MHLCLLRVLFRDVGLVNLHFAVMVTIQRLFTSVTNYFASATSSGSHLSNDENLNSKFLSANFPRCLILTL